MPSPYDIPNHQPPMSKFLRELIDPPEPSLAGEIAALRQEIAALRAELKPVQSLILTGQQVAEEFKRLSKDCA